MNDVPSDVHETRGSCGPTSGTASTRACAVSRLPVPRTPDVIAHHARWAPFRPQSLLTDCPGLSDLPLS